MGAVKEEGEKGAVGFVEADLPLSAEKVLRRFSCQRDLFWVFTDTDHAPGKHLGDNLRARRLRDP